LSFYNDAPNSVARDAIVRFFSFLLMILGTLNALAGKPLHGISLYGIPKYPAHFTHYDYVNPHAPKGGKITIGRIGSFDRVDPLGFQGIPAYGLNFLFTRLMSRAADEPFSLYGLLAESIKIAPNYSYVIFNLRPGATWHDGSPITPEDVISTLHLWQTRGTPGSQQLYKGILKAERVGEHQVKFTLGKPHWSKASILFIAQMPIVSKKNDSIGSLESFLPLGNGPYKLIKVIPGRTLVYQRIPNHWSENLPVNKGRYNFDKIQVDYFRNQTALFEAFKKGKITVYMEEDPKRWYTSFNIPAVHEGQIIQEEIAHHHPVDIDALVFNTRNPLFQNLLVRQALCLAFDFDRLNDKLYYGSLSRTHSYFENTTFAAHKQASGNVLALLKKYQPKIEPSKFQDMVHLNVLHWPCDLRLRLSQAQQLLEQAGWKMVEGVLINEQGQEFDFDVILPSPYYEKMVLAWARNLRLLGIQVHVHVLNAAQYDHLKQTHTFDVIFHTWHQKTLPGRELMTYWSLDAAHSLGSENYPGIQDSMVDDLIVKILKAETYDKLITYTQTLDRVLRAGYYTLLLAHRKKEYVAYWNTLCHPPLNSGMTSYYVSWWMRKAR